MSDAWDKARDLAEKHAQAGGIFVRLANDGDKIVGAFRGDPHTREVVWTGETYESFDPDKHAGKRPSLRVLMNLYVPADGRMKVFEGSTLWFKDVLKVRDKYGLDNWLFEIERHGAAGDPKTSYSVLPEEKIDDALRAQIDAAELHDLASIGESNGEAEAEEDEPPARPAPAKVAPAKAAPGKAAPGKAAATPAATKGALAAAKSGTIETDVALELVGRLKALPRAEADVFLKKFGAARVRDIKASDELKARAFLAELEKKHAAPAEAEAEAGAEVDPFAV
jgi:hypothetical protein